MRSIQLYFMKPLALFLILGLATCTTSPARDKAEAQAPRKAIMDPYGDWYTYNRHMHIGQQDRFLTDSLKNDDSAPIKKYQILSLVERAEDIFLVTLVSQTNPRPEQRVFSLSRNHQTMREMSGKHIIVWSRAP